MSGSGRRVEALRDRLVRAQHDALLVSTLHNIRYLTGFSGSSAIAVVSPRRCTLLTDFRYATQVREECYPHVEVRIEPASLWTGVWDVLAQDSSLKAIAFESADVSHKDFARLQADGTRWHWRPTTDLVEELRRVKEPTELAAIREAGAVAMLALSETLRHVRVGQSELEICGILERALREAGSEAHPFPPIVAAGERSALPHARASTRPVATGDFLLLDFGATVRGYCSDVTRTVVIGGASERQREVYSVVRDAQWAAVMSVRAGMTGREGDAVARAVIEARGYGAEFGHGLGHGIGLEVHESPRMSRLTEDSLPAGSVVTIEPGVYVPGWGGVRIEDDVHLTPTGAELLTEFSRELIELDAR